MISNVLTQRNSISTFRQFIFLHKKQENNLQGTTLMPYNDNSTEHVTSQYVDNRLFSD